MRYRIIGLLAVFSVTSFSAVGWAQSPGHGADLSGKWAGDDEKEDIAGAFMNYAFAEEPPPMTAWALERFEQSKPTFGSRSVPVLETNDPVYECFPPGTPRIYLHPFPMEIVQTPDRVLMLFEYDHIIRQLYLDGREHRTDLAPMWMGDSTGHWEGDALVVETVNFNDKTWVDRRGVPHSEEMRVVERFRRVDESHLEIDVTVEDPVAFPEPWTGTRYYRAVDWDVEEFVCMDNVNFEAFEQEVLDYDGDEN